MELGGGGVLGTQFSQLGALAMHARKLGALGTQSREPGGPGSTIQGARDPCRILNQSISLTCFTKPENKIFKTSFWQYILLTSLGGHLLDIGLNILSVYGVLKIVELYSLSGLWPASRVSHDIYFGLKIDQNLLQPLPSANVTSFWNDWYGQLFGILCKCFHGVF